MTFHWQDLATISVIWATLMAALVFVFRPVLDKLWIATFLRSKNDIKVLLNGWYGTSEGTKRLEAIERDIVRQNEDASRERKAIMQAVEKNSETMEQLGSQIESAGSSIAHIYGVIKAEPWDGKEDRRKSERRNK